MVKQIQLTRIPKNRKLFEEAFVNFTKKISIERNKDKYGDTLFTNQGENMRNNEKIIEEAYSLFESRPEFQELREESLNITHREGVKKCETFLEDIYMNVLFSEILENINTLDKIGFKTEMLIENTMDKYPQLNDIKELDRVHTIISNPELIQEGWILDNAEKVLKSGKMFLKDIGIGTMSFLGLMLFGRRETSGRNAYGGLFNALKVGLMAVPDMFSIKEGDDGEAVNTFQQSRKNFFDFDKIESNKNVNYLFKRLSANSNEYKQAPVLLENLVNQCIENHHQMFDNLELSENEKNDLKKKKYNPRTNSTVVEVLKQLWSEMISKNSHTKSAVLSFRKCLAGTFSDVYKYLMIGVLSQDENRKKISGLLTKGTFESNPQTLLRFMQTETDSESMIKSVSILTQIRLEFNNIINGLKKGGLSIDKESARFFEQKLKEADMQISDFLTTHKGLLRDAKENEKNSDEEDKNFNPSEKKRSILGL